MRAPALARLCLAVLVVATFLAIFYAQALKRRTQLLLRPYPGVRTFQPLGVRPRGVDREAHFFVRTSVPDTLRVAIVSGRGGRTVFTVTVRLRKYVSSPVIWDGRSTSGSLSPAGDYVVAVHLQAENETVRPGLTLRLLGPAA